MKLKLAASCLVIISQSFAANDTSAWSSAAKAYNQNNLAVLGELATANLGDQLIAYFNASANLARANPLVAQNFVKQSKDSYYRNELVHQLLSYYFNNQNWDNYLQTYPLLPIDLATSNETCGYDVANFARNNHKALKSDLNALIGNKMPLWCISLVASKLNDGSLDRAMRLPFLYGLITNDQVFQYNQLAASFKLPKVNANSNATANLDNPYQIVYRISNLSNKSPDSAFNELSSSNHLDKPSKQYLYNLVAADLASRQMFNLANAALDLGSNLYLSNDEWEWRARTYLALNNWQQLIATIKQMPQPLQKKNSWRYWLAYADGKLGMKTQAQTQLLQIPADYSYYSLLAQAELKTPLNVTTTPNQLDLSQISQALAAQQSFTLYQMGKKQGNSTLVRLATQSLYYIISQSSDGEIAAISRKAHSIGWTEMGISAASRMQIPQASLSFPILFQPEYKQYSRQYGIPMTYPMAISRQESRFNPNALAFDGGVGLMQIMPATAAYIAKKTSSRNCFHDYDCNIKFGSWFLSHLLNKFGNNYIYASAGYNAGPGRAHRWQMNFANLDNRVQIELIPFKITRDYVQKVLTNKLVYDNLLGDSTRQIDMLTFLAQINNQDTTFIVDDDNTTGDASGTIAQ